MARNVHKEDVSIFKLPQDAIQEDRGLRTCSVPQLVLATTMDVVSYKNDRTAIAYKFESMSIELEDASGTVTAAPGIAVSFPNQSDAVGYVIDWRQVLTGGGALAQGCYRVRVNWTLAGNSGWFYHGSYNLLEYSIFNARGTARLYVVLNDVVRKQGINYKDSGFAGTVRFDGIFGFMQPNYDTENNTHTDRTRYKVRIEALRSYELRTSYLNRCATRLLDEDTLLAANQIYVTDHNAGNHDQSIYDFPVILDENESPSFEYPTGSVFAKITAKFLDKVAYHESKYDGNIAGSENVILQLPTVTASCADATVENSDLSYINTVASGDTLVLPDVTITDSDGTPITVPSVQNFVCTPQIVCADATVENSDVTYTATVVSGGTLVLPDVTITDSDGTPVTVPSVQNFVCTPQIVCADATVENSDLSYSATVASGGTLVVPDTTYNIYVNAVLDQSFSVPSISTQTINITP